ncbi:PREDICTED: glycoprotein 3-alpha-L-fucosyltransferase A-like isoform X2 [Ipomoea nil]|uniref:glycoprotein 3-alpha-L-fucosyltransferase A-like isoform X2 n=1 Tax=Ipomoea nil TaxID=35883 RepID=UPI000900C7ED|nr:PREDICTED: glycoprotein 3-alpha-L-fucosyltransferase A-like isoform X2 [Ipomoea nil]
MLPSVSTGGAVMRISRAENGHNAIGSPKYSSGAKKKCSNWLPIFVAFVVIAEIAFLGRLDVTKNVDLVNSWAHSFYQFTAMPWSSTSADGGDDRGYFGGRYRRFGYESCEDWLERVDVVTYTRNFDKDPILLRADSEELAYCAVGCIVGGNYNKQPDAVFGLMITAPNTTRVLRSMESSKYYPDNNIASAKRRGYDVVMTTSLSSDVPVGYFSWAEYDLMAPLQPKTEKALAAAFISNCGGRNFRLPAFEALVSANISIDSYGRCYHNKDGNVNKVEALKRYKFSLAFENSNEEDYVTEKFFQSLVAGSIPVVVGAPNIQDFAPSLGSVLHIKELSDAEKVANTMTYLDENPSAYNQALRWKFEGPSVAFKALIDMGAVHSSCRLCIHLATRIREREEKSPTFSKRPCKCTRGSETVYHVYVRERGRFEMESIFLRSGNLTMEAFESAVLLKFMSRKHVPIWKEERPKMIRGGDELTIYRIYPLGMTQRQALYSFKFEGDNQFREHIESNLCAKFEVIFV